MMVFMAKTNYGDKTSLKKTKKKKEEVEVKEEKGKKKHEKKALTLTHEEMVMAQHATLRRNRK